MPPTSTAPGRVASRRGPRSRIWGGRWWTLWGTTDLVAVGGKVLIATPAFFNPFMDAGEIVPTGRDKGRIALATGYASHGEPARLVRNRAGRVVELWLAGNKLLPEAKVAAEMEARYEPPKGRRRR